MANQQALVTIQNFLAGTYPAWDETTATLYANLTADTSVIWSPLLQDCDQTCECSSALERA